MAEEYRPNKHGCLSVSVCFIASFSVCESIRSPFLKQFFLWPSLFQLMDWSHIWHMYIYIKICFFISMWVWSPCLSHTHFICYILESWFASPFFWPHTEKCWRGRCPLWELEALGSDRCTFVWLPQVRRLRPCMQDIWRSIPNHWPCRESENHEQKRIDYI